jgi:hypothetical protein
LLGGHNEAFWETTFFFPLDSERERERGGMGVITEVSDFIFYLYIKDESPLVFNLQANYR